MSRGYNGINEKDWKLFRKKLPDWQESYMDKLNHEYIELLSGDDNPSEKFWTLAERIKEDQRDAGVQVDMSRSKMEFNLMDLIDEGAITVEDLDGFSEELRDKIETYAELRRRRMSGD